MNEPRTLRRSKSSQEGFKSILEDQAYVLKIRHKDLNPYNKGFESSKARFSNKIRDMYPRQRDLNPQACKIH